MRCLIFPLYALVLVAMAERPCSAGDPAAAELAVLIDQQIDTRLRSEKAQPAAMADDAEFVRRIYLDLHGTVPTLEQARRFLTDAAPDKRARLVDALLADERYGFYMADIWQGYLMSPLADEMAKRTDLFRGWLATQFNTRRWDQIVTDLLTATGRMENNPAVTYLIEARLPRAVPDLTDLTSRYFLGVRLNCAQCHDHPVVKWKQEEFWGLAAFFTQIQTPKRAKQVYEKGVVDDPTLTLASLTQAGNPDGFRPSAPTFLGGQPLSAAAGQTHRAALAAWMTTPQNPWFARAMVNRTWWRLFGHGLVQPVDDMHEGNAPSHALLLDGLARKFAASGYDLKFLTRAIVLTRAYQRTNQGASADATGKLTALFGRMAIKVLSAGQLYDSLETICGSPGKVSGIDTRQGARWEFVQFFGESGDPDSTAYRRGIPHLLRQMNSGQFALSTLQTPQGAGGANAAQDALVSDVFLTLLSRQPTAEERRQASAFLTSGGSGSGLRELAWVLMMTSEFSLNH